jgi:hypothetical protein
MIHHLQNDRYLKCGNGAEVRVPVSAEFWPFLSCIMHTRCAGFSKAGTWYQVPGIRHWITAHLEPDTWYRMRSNTEGRTPSTEDRARPPENAHTGYASCILHP